MTELTHPDEVAAIHKRILDDSPVGGSYIEVEPGNSVHMIEAGEGSPLVLLHGTLSSALSLLPLMEYLEGIRVIAPDRPGHGLSDPPDGEGDRFRQGAVAWVDGLLDALALEQTALGGASMGGTWALWYAQAHPARIRRLVLLSGTPFLPGTRAPLPLRLLAAPLLGELIGRFPPDEQMLLSLIDTIEDRDNLEVYPDLLESFVILNRDPLASRTNRAELRATMSLLGLRSEMRIPLADLGEVETPTLLFWGEDDPVGDVDDAEAVADAIPDARLEVLPAGHLPWLGYPQRVAEQISAFVA